MKKNFLFLLPLLLFFTFLSGCKSPNISKTSEERVLLTSFTILEDMLKNIAGDFFVVESITKSLLFKGEVNYSSKKGLNTPKLSLVLSELEYQWPSKYKLKDLNSIL